MKIAINAISLPSKVAGGTTYLVNLLDQIAAIDEENTYYLITGHHNKQFFNHLSKFPNFNIKVFPLSFDSKILRVFFEQILLPLYLFKEKFDILFSPRNISPIFNPCKSVIVVHSIHLNYEYNLNNYSFLEILVGKFLLHHSVKKADRVIAISNFCRESLLQMVRDAEPDKIKPIYHGIHRERFQHYVKNKDAEISILGRWGVRLPYILFISNLANHKNADKLIYAYKKLRERKATEHCLVIVGRDVKGNMDKLRKLTEKLSIGQYVVFTGSVPHEIMPTLYRQADIFVFPSSTETFGLPILESMSCGTPVIGSNRTCVPEVTGDAGIIVDPEDISKLSDAIELVITDGELRQALIKKGYERVKKFYWRKTAEETLKIFREVGNSGEVNKD